LADDPKNLQRVAAGASTYFAEIVKQRVEGLNELRRYLEMRAQAVASLRPTPSECETFWRTVARRTRRAIGIVEQRHRGASGSAGVSAPGRAAASSSWRATVDLVPTRQ
jgi:hypothetical protein